MTYHLSAETLFIDSDGLESKVKFGLCDNVLLLASGLRGILCRSLKRKVHRIVYNWQFGQEGADIFKH